MIVGLKFGHLLFKEITSFVGITFPSLTLIVLIEGRYLCYQVGTFS